MSSYREGQFAHEFAFMEQALDLARRAGAAAEVYLISGERLPVNFEAGRLKRIERTRHQALALRVIHEGRMGLSSTTVTQEPAKLVERALAAARFGPEVEFGFPAESPGTDPGDWWDGRVAALEPDVMLEWGRGFVEQVAAVEGVLAHATVARDATVTRVMNTVGLDAFYRKTGLTAVLIAEVTEEGNFLHVYDWDSSTGLDVDVAAMAAEVVDDLQVARRNVEFATGEYPVVLAPRAVRDLLGPIMACVDGRAVQRGISPWRGRLGEAMFHPSFSLLDDGRLPGAAGSALCDDEGVPTRRTPIIESGVLRSFLLDLESAAALGMAPTGNGSRSDLADGPPVPRPTNLLIPAGERPRDEMLAGVKDGLLVENFMGAWSGNLYAGVVTGNVALGYRLRHGERVGRVKDCMFSVNAFTALKEALGGISRETRRLGSVRFPYLLLERATVTVRSS
jgi:PmbA protein